MAGVEEIRSDVRYGQFYVRDIETPVSRHTFIRLVEEMEVNPERVESFSVQEDGYEVTVDTVDSKYVGITISYFKKKTE